MHRLTRAIILELLSFSTVQNINLFVVGGTLRDYLLLKPGNDFDFTGKNAAEFGRSFSVHLNFTCISLDNTPGRNTVRVILDQNQQLDFTDLQGKNIEEDLSQRDFTINAMGLSLKDFLGKRKDVIDPHNGQKDLINRKIRVLPGPIFQSDPLRILRAFRFAATLGFEIDKETLGKISQHKSKIMETAQERIWHEMSLFFKAPCTKLLLDLLHSTGLLGNIFPRSNKTYSRTSTQYENLENLIQEPEKIFPEYSDELNTNGLDNNQYLLKVSVLLMGEIQDSVTETGSVEKPRPLSDQSWELRPSNAETKFIDQTLNGAWYLAQGYAKKNLSLNEIYELIHTIQEEILASVFLFVSSLDSNDGNVTLFCNRIFEFYFHQYLPTINKKPLLNGEDIIREFDTPPSPLIGKILYNTQKAHVLGDIATHDEAKVLAGEIIQSQKLGLKDDD